MNDNITPIHYEHKPIIVEFPLKGEWFSPNTPGTKIPSHGTNRLGTRYAYDFIQVDWKRKGYPSYRASFLKYLICGLQIDNYYCWGKEIYAPCDGVIIQAKDNYRENLRTNLFSDFHNAYKNAHYFDIDNDDIQKIAGNYVIIKYLDNVYAALCHLQSGSIRVSVGQSITAGEMIGKVGHSGNSFSPHLHFQLMNSANMRIAQGLPCAFKEYELFHNGKWEKIRNGIPAKGDRIRFLK